MSDAKYKRLTIDIDADLYAELEASAGRRGIKVPELIRRAVALDTYIWEWSQAHPDTDGAPDPCAWCSAPAHPGEMCDRSRLPDVVEAGRGGAVMEGERG